MNKGYTYLIFAALSYASMGALIKLLSFDSGALLQTFLRLIVACMLTFLLVIVTKKPFLLKNKSDYLLMFFMGTVGYALQIILFTMALYYNTISNTLFIFSSYPIIAALMAYVFLKENITKRLRVAFVLLGCSLFLLFNLTGVAETLLGNLLAFFACVTTAFYIIGSRILSKRGNAAETITLWSISIGVITSGIAAGIFEGFTMPHEPSSYLILAIFGLLNAAAFTFINKGFATVKAGIGTMILLLEPVLGSFLGLVFFNEFPTTTFLIGAVVMLTAIYIATFKLD